MLTIDEYHLLRSAQENLFYGGFRGQDLVLLDELIKPRGWVEVYYDVGAVFHGMGRIKLTKSGEIALAAHLEGCKDAAL